MDEHYTAVEMKNETPVKLINMTQIYKQNCILKKQA